MSLSTRIPLVLVLVVTVFVAVDQMMQRNYVASTFEELEYRGALAIHRRARALLDEGSARMGARGSAAWAGIASGEAPELQPFGIDLLVVIDQTNSVRFHRIEDPASRAPLALRSFPSRGLSIGHPLIAADLDRLAKSDEPYVSGLMETDSGILLACSVEHVTQDGGKGRLIAGSFLTDELLTELMADVGATVQLWPVSSVPPDEVDESVRMQLASLPMEFVVGREDGGHLVFGMLTTVLRKPTLIMRSTTVDSITEIGLRTARFSTLSTGAVALLILLFLIFLLRRIVIRPLGLVTAHAVEVRLCEYAHRPLEIQRSDEIGQLADEYNGMMQTLTDSRSEVVRTARLAGMSEIASGVIHNLGNALTSVGVSLDQLRKHLGCEPVDDLGRINAVLKQHGDDLVRFLTEDPRGSTLPVLLQRLEESMGESRATTRSELGDLEEGVERMRQLVVSQQNHATLSSGVLEGVKLEQEVDAAIDICDMASATPQQIEIVRSYQGVPVTQVDRYKLREILVNLIRNARQAVARTSRSDKRVTVSVKRSSADMLQVDVEDNGVGIAEANLSRVFNHGFTTRADGNGFGLHASANAARELGGKLTAESDGEGLGARFTLLIELRPAGLATSVAKSTPSDTPQLLTD